MTVSGERPLDHPELGLRAGDWVWVRTQDEILATLDERGRLDGLPFQPEMFAFCGRRMRVRTVAHKTCDTIHKTGGRRMRRAVHLEGANCDGAAHGGCQADCNFFWKEAWLTRDAGTAPRSSSEARCTETEARCTETDVLKAVHPDGLASGDDVWSCQTTALFEATAPLKWWDLRQYVRDVTSGNHRPWPVARRLLFAGYRSLLGLGVGYRLLLALYDSFQKLRGGRPFPVANGAIPEGKTTPTEVLNLKPGDWVEIKSPEEISTTITRAGFNRGMRFDIEMIKYCGGRYRVQMRVDRLINEQTGKMLEFKNPCIQLDDVYCRAECTSMRLGCPRAMNTYWREIWLRRVETPSEAPTVR